MRNNGRKRILGRVGAGLGALALAATLAFAGGTLAEPSATAPAATADDHALVGLLPTVRLPIGRLWG